MVIMALIMTSKKTMPIKLWQGKQWRHDLLISIQHSLPIPRGAPTLNHIGAQQLSLENWVLVMTIIHYPLAMIIILIVLLLLQWHPHPLWVTWPERPKGSRRTKSRGPHLSLLMMSMVIRKWPAIGTSGIYQSALGLSQIVQGRGEVV